MKTSTRDPLKQVTPSHFLQVRVDNTDSRRFGLKNITITGEAAPADEEAAATFPAELKKLTKQKGMQV